MTTRKYTKNINYKFLEFVKYAIKNRESML